AGLPRSTGTFRTRSPPMWRTGMRCRSGSARRMRTSSRRLRTGGTLNASCRPLLPRGHIRTSGLRIGPYVILDYVTLMLGGYPVDPPVVLAPMAGITNRAFRKLCREQGAGVYVCEMITTVALAHRNPKTDRLIEFGEEESPRSMQLYGVDPEITAKA